MVTASPLSGSSRAKASRSASARTFSGISTASTPARRNAVFCISGESECAMGFPATPKMRVLLPILPARYKVRNVRAVTWPGAVSSPSASDAKVNRRPHAARECGSAGPPRPSPCSRCARCGTVLDQPQHRQVILECLRRRNHLHDVRIERRYAIGRASQLPRARDCRRRGPRTEA